MNIYNLKSYGLDYISCTVFTRVTEYKSLLLVAHAITALLVYGHGREGWGTTTTVVIFVGPIPTRRGRVIKHRSKRLEIGGEYYEEDNSKESEGETSRIT